MRNQNKQPWGTCNCVKMHDNIRANHILRSTRTTAQAYCAWQEAHGGSESQPRYGKVDGLAHRSDFVLALGIEDLDAVASRRLHAQDAHALFRLFLLLLSLPRIRAQTRPGRGGGFEWRVG